MHTRTRLNPRLGPAANAVGLLLLVCTVFYVGLSTAVAWAADSDGESTASQAVRSMTLRLLEIPRNTDRGASPEAREAAMNQLRGLVAARRQALLDLMETHPEVVMEVALNEDLSRPLPKELRSQLERRVTVQGRLELVFADDLDLHLSKVYYFLTTDKGRRFQLHFAEQATELTSGSRIRVHGVRLDDQLALATTDTTSVETVEAASLTPAKLYKVLVLLLNFDDNPVQPYTPDTARAVTFTSPTSANAYYQEASFGKVELAGKLNADGDVFGWYTIPCRYYDSAGTLISDCRSSCSQSTWSSEAKKAATAAGVDVTGYDRIVTAFPKTGACSWWGLGGGTSAWINGTYSLKVVAHELGHTFGISHANTYSCTDSTGQRVPISSSCVSTEYADPFDVMGNITTSHFNAYHKSRLSYFDTTAHVVKVTGDGLYSIAPLEIPSSGVQALQIPRDFDSQGNALTYYHVEYRRPYGFDNSSYIYNSTCSSTASCASDGVLIHYAPASRLLDLSPATTSFTDGALLVDRTFEDPIKGISITTKSTSATEATVEVPFGPIDCTPGRPSVSMTPSTAWGFSGQSLGYTVALTNNNTSACPPATFDLIPSLPEGWVQEPDSLALTLASGSSATANIMLTSALWAEPGFYTVSETAADPAHAEAASSASAAYNVQPPDVTPPVVTIASPLDGAKLPSKGSVKLSAKAADASGIGRIELMVDGVLLKTCTNSSSCAATWSVKGVAGGGHTITAVATDKGMPAPNVASSSVAVVKP